MEYFRGPRALLRDPDWKPKLGVASLLILSTMMIPVVGQLVLGGWLVIALRRAVQGQDHPLPRLELNMDYLAKLFGVGIKPFVAQLLYTLPLIAGVMVLYCVAGGAFYAARASGSDAVLAIVGVVLAVLYLGGILTMTIFMHVAVMRASLMDNLGEAVSPKAVFATVSVIKKELVVSSIVFMLIAMGIALLGMLACYVGIFPAAVVISLAQTYLHAELYRVYLEKGGAPLPIGALEA
jgi:hypothetical protein